MHGLLKRLDGVMVVTQRAVDSSSRGSSAPVILSIEQPPPPPKRITSEQLKKMRHQQTHQQKVVSTSVRFVSGLWAALRAWLASPMAMFGKKVYQCDVNGHALTRAGTYDFLPVCRFCGRHVESVDEFRTV